MPKKKNNCRHSFFFNFLKKNVNLQYLFSIQPISYSVYLLELVWKVRLKNPGSRNRPSNQENWASYKVLKADMSVAS